MRGMHAATTAAATVLSLAVATAILAGPASASSTDGQVTAISTSISRAERFENQTGAEVRTVTTAPAGTTSATLPTRANDGVKLHAGIGAQVSVGLPGATAADSGRTASDGTVVYTHAARSASVAAQALPGGGASLLVAIDGADAPTEYSFPVNLPAGVQLQASGDGGYFAGLPGGQVLTIAAPWARDAVGKTVPTTYRLEGQTLIQTVAHAGFTYPIVADPYITLGWYVYLHYTKADISRYWSGTTFLNQAAAAAACAAIAGAYGAAACGSLSGGWFSSIGNTFATAKAKNECVVIAMTYAGLIPVQWNPVAC